MLAASVASAVYKADFMSDICYACDGTGDRCFLSAAPCRECGGTGWLDDEEEDENHPECLTCWDSGEVPTHDYESYFGAQMKPCPDCMKTLNGIGHGKLS